MKKLVEMIASGEISAEDLANAQDLIERANLVKQALEAVSKNLVFPLGVDNVSCYSYMDRAGEYYAYGMCSRDGVVRFYSNWGGNHLIGSCNLNDFSSVFMAFENQELAGDLRRFLEAQIAK